jgi:hypothetical protein
MTRLTINKQAGGLHLVSTNPNQVGFHPPTSRKSNTSPLLLLHPQLHPRAPPTASPSLLLHPPSDPQVGNLLLALVILHGIADTVVVELVL